MTGTRFAIVFHLLAIRSLEVRIGFPRENAAWQKYVGTLAGSAACGVRDAKRSSSRVAPSLEIRLSLQVCRCELSAVFYERPKERVLRYHRTPFEFRS